MGRTKVFEGRTREDVTEGIKTRGVFIDFSIWCRENEFNVPTRGLSEHFCEGKNQLIGMRFCLLYGVVETACFDLQVSHEM